MAQQDAQWKEAYDVLLAENNVLKSSGSEAMLASQWRQRYEVCLKEKEDTENKLKMERQKSESTDAGGKYELKYRDLKESFRLYRKKAKEIFEAQQSGEHGVRTPIVCSLSGISHCEVVAVVLVVAAFLSNVLHAVPLFTLDSSYHYRITPTKMPNFPT
jgi:hypothetical protein